MYPPKKKLLTAESVPNGFLASLHAERQLRQQGKQHAKTVCAAEVDDEFSVDGALAVSAGGSDLASNQAYQDGAPRIHNNFKPRLSASHE